MDPKTNFRVVVLQTELERWKFLVRSLVRCRIGKVSKVFGVSSLFLGDGNLSFALSLLVATF
jgi:hypothetical protein